MSDIIAFIILYYFLLFAFFLVGGFKKKATLMFCLIPPMGIGVVVWDGIISALCLIKINWRKLK